MSGETFVVGTLEIAPDVPEEKKAKIIEDFERVMETDMAWDDYNKEYKFSHVNWLSHVREEDIKECYQKHKRHIVEPLVLIRSGLRSVCRPIRTRADIWTVV